MPSWDECTLSVMCYAKGSIAEAAENMLDAVVSAVATGLEWSLRTMGELIMSENTITSSEGEAIGWLQHQTIFLTSALTLISIFIAAGQMIWTRRGQPLKDLTASLLKLVVIAGASVSGIIVLVEAGDAWATWIMRSVNGEDWVTEKMLDSFVGMTPVGPIIMILLGLCGIVAGFIQWVLQFLRIPLLILLAGLWPMAAAATNTEWGKGWFQKMTGWIVAFLAFKPAVGIILALGQRLMFSTDDTGTWRPMAEGLILIVMSCLAPAALIKFIVPAAGAMGSGGGNAAAALASGATMVATGSMAAASGGASTAAEGAVRASGASNTAGASGTADSGAAGSSNGAGGSAPTTSRSGGKHAAGGSGSSITDGVQSSSDTAGTSDTADSGERASGSENESASAAKLAGGSGESGSQGASSNNARASGFAEGLAGGPVSAGGAAASGGAGTAAGAWTGPAGMAVMQAGQAAAGALKDTAEESTADGSEE